MENGWQWSLRSRATTTTAGITAASRLDLQRHRSYAAFERDAFDAAFTASSGRGEVCCLPSHPLCDGQSRQANACAKGGNQCLRIDPEEANPPTYVTQQRKNPPIGVASAQDSRVPGDGEDLCME